MIIKYLTWKKRQLSKKIVKLIDKKMVVEGLLQRAKKVGK